MSLANESEDPLYLRSVHLNSSYWSVKALTLISTSHLSPFAGQSWLAVRAWSSQAPPASLEVGAAASLSRLCISMWIGEDKSALLAFAVSLFTSCIAKTRQQHPTTLLKSHTTRTTEIEGSECLGVRAERISSADIDKCTSIENLVRFDSDHVLDVHSARLYPFDQYLLSSSLRAATTNNETIRISRAITLRITSSFDVETTDLESFVLAPVIRNQTNSTVAANDTSADAEIHLPSRDIDMHISRPPSAQLFTFLLFGASWILTHISVGLAVLARKRKDPQSLLAYLLSSGFILVGIPQLRNGMPDAPGFDGKFA